MKHITKSLILVFLLNFFLIDAEEECIQTNNHNSAIKISRDKECQSTDDAYLSAIMGD